jgi:hypothetical protein
LFEWTQVPPERRGLSKVWEDCNWLQALEGGIDSSHSNFLHGGRPPGLRYDDDDPRGRANNYSTAPQLEVVPTDYGYSYAGIRDMGPDGTNHVRGYHLVLPWCQIRSTGAGRIAGHIWVPVDDYNTMVYNWHYIYDPELAQQRSRRGEEDARPAGNSSPIWYRDARLPLGAGNEFGVDVDVDNGFRSLRNRGNRDQIDRMVQKTQTYTGISGINTQDRAVQESMGRIADRSLERLGTTDRAIIASRRFLLQAVSNLKSDADPPGVAPSYYKLRAIEKVLPKDVNWFEAMRSELFQLPESEAVAAVGS